MKKTKIICSIGPATSSFEVFSKLIEAGMNVARINFSHATMEERATVEGLVERANKELGSYIATLYDTKGPDFRTGNMENDSIELVNGKTIRIVKEDVLGTEERFTVNYKQTIDCMSVGNTVLLEDGLMKLEIISKEEDGVTCMIIAGGTLGSRKGINVPGIDLNIPFLSDIDREDITYAAKKNGDFLALSFVNSKEDILAVKELLKELNSDIKIISKVESQAAINNIDEIVENSDGVMVARGDLGVEVPMQQLPILQKMIVKKCREQGKFCIVATEMLASMYKNARPTRAEVTDIANAVLDGTDAVMLSGETTIGKYPEDAVAYMANICKNTEDYLDYNNQICPICAKDITSAIATSAVASANALEVKGIVATTISGNTARKISTLRPKSAIVATCPSVKTALSLALNFGVYPKVVPIYETTDEIIEKAKEEATSLLNLEKDDKLVVVGGFPKNQNTNFMKIEQI
ncbi:MAG: pyruvate kinase [Bacilli bacterium]|nr:pyruvate kinase [Bacilli bacterium]